MVAIPISVTKIQNKTLFADIHGVERFIRTCAVLPSPTNPSSTLSYFTTMLACLLVVRPGGVVIVCVCVCVCVLQLLARSLKWCPATWMAQTKQYRLEYISKVCSHSKHKVLRMMLRHRYSNASTKMHATQSLRPLSLPLSHATLCRHLSIMSLCLVSSGVWSTAIAC
jgi:hypothetical protein